MGPRRAKNEPQRGHDKGRQQDNFSGSLGSRQASKTPTDVTTGRSGRKLNQTTDQLPHTTGSTQLFD